jgi:hypothetical protein
LAFCNNANQAQTRLPFASGLERSGLLTTGHITLQVTYSRATHAPRLARPAPARAGSNVSKVCPVCTSCSDPFRRRHRLNAQLSEVTVFSNADQSPLCHASQLASRLHVLQTSCSRRCENELKSVHRSTPAHTSDHNAGCCLVYSTTCRPPD